MKRLRNYITEAGRGFDTAWFMSPECSELFNKHYSKLSRSEHDLFLIVENTEELWNRYNELMKSAVRHPDFSAEKCACSKTMSDIIRKAVARHNAASDSQDRIGRLSAESKKNIGMCLVCRWEQ